jgi:hypothetical protein
LFITYTENKPTADFYKEEEKTAIKIIKILFSNIIIREMCLQKT